MKKIRVIIFFILLAWLIILTYNEFKPTKEAWKCSAVECTSFVKGQEWIDKNCFLLENQEVCKININNIDQVIPLQNINLSLVQQCVEFRCVEEIKIRNASYKINL